MYQHSAVQFGAAIAEKPGHTFFLWRNICAREKFHALGPMPPSGPPAPLASAQA